MLGRIELKPASLGLFLGAGAFLALAFGPPLDPARPEVGRMAAIAALMAIWWITEAIPLAATALLPVALFPLFGIMGSDEVAPVYCNHLIFLFLGGFLVALAMQRWDLHRRMALWVLLRSGSQPRRILLGFMVASAFLSMWISNSAATMMMVPIAIAITARLCNTEDEHSQPRFATAILLGVAYAASAGGIATLVGTPPNLSFTRIYSISFPAAPEISFAQWFSFGLPVSVVLLTVIWAVLVRRYIPKESAVRADQSVFRAELAKFGRMKPAEWRVLIVFGLMIAGWLFRKDINFGAFSLPGWSSALPLAKGISDGSVAVIMAITLFLLPAGGGLKTRVLDWETAEKLPYGMILLFGGGFALASGFKASGLSDWIGTALQGLQGVHPILLVLIVCAALTFLTELTSNLATTEMVLPVLAAMTVKLELHPLLLMVPATVSCSCAFMLPVATPPNAIAFGSRRIAIRDMVRTGLGLNLIAILIVTLMTMLLGEATLGIDRDVFPDWARDK